MGNEYSIQVRFEWFLIYCSSWFRMSLLGMTLRCFPVAQIVKLFMFCYWNEKSYPLHAFVFPKRSFYTWRHQDFWVSGRSVEVRRISLMKSSMFLYFDGVPSVITTELRWKTFHYKSRSTETAYCDKKSDESNVDSAGQGQRGVCGSAFAYPFFISFYIICSFLVSDGVVASVMALVALRFVSWHRSSLYACV